METFPIFDMLIYISFLFSFEVLTEESWFRKMFSIQVGLGIEARTQETYSCKHFIHLVKGILKWIKGLFR